MKQLLLMRHAKAESTYGMANDFERALSEKGLVNAPEMAMRLFNKNLIPDHIICSAAKRTVATATLVAQKLDINPKDIESQYDLYDAETEDIVHILENINDTYQLVMLVGHNPIFTSIVGHLSNKQIDNLPTAGIVMIEFNINSWKMLRSQKGDFKWMDFPKNSS